jgi:hypothetical protein
VLLCWCRLFHKLVHVSPPHIHELTQILPTALSSRNKQLPYMISATPRSVQTLLRVSRAKSRLQCQPPSPKTTRMPVTNKHPEPAFGCVLYLSRRFFGFEAPRRLFVTVCQWFGCGRLLRLLLRMPRGAYRYIPRVQLSHMAWLRHCMCSASTLMLLATTCTHWQPACVKARS